MIKDAGLRRFSATLRSSRRRFAWGESLKNFCGAKILHESPPKIRLSEEIFKEAIFLLSFAQQKNRLFKN